jgi:ADP-ribosylglycohydrolase
MKANLSASTACILGLMETDQLRSLLRLEIRQMEEEGFDVKAFKDSFEGTVTQKQLIEAYIELLNAVRLKEFIYYEPETLEDIHQARPHGPRQAGLELKPDEAYDRVYGGWLGRTAGCLLGKPVEPWGYKDKIARYLRLVGSYPLTNYFPRLENAPDEFPIAYAPEGVWLGKIKGAPEDDDTDYSILGLHILETYGTKFTTANVAAEWLSHLAFHKTYTAERAAYRNLILGIPAEEAAKLLNPEREYIGARIRIDTYGLAAAGRPELAAEMAYRDARLSHTRNGVYSAMFTSACIAWAFVTKDIEEIIWVGLSEIPSNCRQAEAIREVMSLHKETPDWENAFEQLLPKYGEYDPVHAINNTVVLVLALLYGEADFEKTICTAVMCGADSDCNGANAGTIAGILCGAHGLPEKWTLPLNDHLNSSVSQFSETRISDLARRTTLIKL